MTDSIKYTANQPIQNEQFWHEQIKLRQESGLSRVGYCRLHGLICSKFDYWERKLNPKPAKLSKLLPVKVTPGESVSNSIDTKCTLTLKTGHVLKIHDQSILPVLISLLK